MSDAIPKSVTRLIDEFSRLPGIGPKSAARLTYYLLRSPDEDQVRRLADALTDLKTSTKYCSTCFNITQSNPCGICTSDRRDHKIICVVEEPLDVLAIEKVGIFQGVYHVLHGAINPMENIGPDQLRIAELQNRITHGEVNEIILATNVGLEGDATAMYIHRLLKDKVRMTRLARGLPVGGDLEYVDSMTLAGALDGRRDMGD